MLVAPTSLKETCTRVASSESDGPSNRLIHDRIRMKRRSTLKPPRGMRVIATARTVHAINYAAKEGFRPLVKQLVPSKKIHSMYAVYQHEETGEIIVSGDVRWPPEG